LKEEAQTNKDYMQQVPKTFLWPFALRSCYIFMPSLSQYKGIAQTNEIALKQIESAHEEYKLEVNQRL